MTVYWSGETWKMKKRGVSRGLPAASWLDFLVATAMIMKWLVSKLAYTKPGLKLSAKILTTGAAGVSPNAAAASVVAIVESAWWRRNSYLSAAAIGLQRAADEKLFCEMKCMYCKSMQCETRGYITKEMQSQLADPLIEAMKAWRNAMACQYYSVNAMAGRENEAWRKEGTRRISMEKRLNANNGCG